MHFICKMNILCKLNYDAQELMKTSPIIPKHLLNSADIHAVYFILAVLIVEAHACHIIVMQNCVVWDIGLFNKNINLHRFIINY